MSLSSDDSRLITASSDETARVWDCRAFSWDVDKALCQAGLVGPERIPAQIDDDGWLRTTDPEGGLLFWVPEEHRRAVCDMSKLRFPNIPSEWPIRIEWDQLMHGERWTKVRSTGVEQK